MPDMVHLHLVDAFTTSRYNGNVAGVVMDADHLTDQQMQLIAREVNASETAFLSRANDLHQPTQIRWFTPTIEVGFCGHATLASIHALAELSGFDQSLANSGEMFVFECAAGDLHLQCNQLDAETGCSTWWLGMPEPGLSDEKSNPKKLTDALGIELGDLDSSVPLTRTRDNDVIAIVRRFETLNNIRPDLGLLTSWQERNKVRGVLVSTLNTLSESVHVQSRFFAPAAGVPEDPVTGSVHGPLGTLLVIQEMVPLVDNSAGLVCLQGIPGGRMGMIHVAVKASNSGYDVAIAGSCVTTMRGELNVPSQE